MSDRPRLETEIAGMEVRASDRIAKGVFQGHRGLAEHHARVLRQAKARLAALDAQAAGGTP